MTCQDQNGEVFVGLPFIARAGCRQPALSPTDQQALKDRIGKLQLALDQLMMGYQVRVTVDQNGERLEFGSVSVIQLKNYIQSLQAQLPGYCPTGAGGAVAAPMRFWF